MRGSLGVLAVTLRNPRLRRVQVAFLGFSLGEYAVWTAILVYAYRHGGTTVEGLIAVLQLGPSAVAAPVAAAYTERRGGLAGLTLGYALQAVTNGLTGALMLLSGSPGAVYAAAVLAACAVTVSRPAQAKALSGLARQPEELTGATALSSWTEGWSSLLGPALGGGLIALDGPGGTFAVIALALALCTWMVAFRRDRPSGEHLAEEEPAGGLREGLAVLRSDRGARALVSLIGVEYLAIGALEVLVVVLAISRLRLGAPGAGYLSAVFGGGAAIGGFFALGLAGAGRIATPLLAAAVLWGVALLVLGLQVSALGAFVLLPVAGVCQALVEGAARSLLARTTSHEVLGRVFGLLEGVTMAALGVGALLVPILAGLGGAEATLIGVGAILIATALAFQHRLRALQSVVRSSDAVLSLRSHRLFTALPPAALEGLARELSRFPVGAGEVVVAEGDVGDRFYLIASGEFDVSVVGEHVRTLGIGEGFGEIALLRDVRRTATVTARTGGLLYAIEREPFVAALRPAI